jgi:carbonic anhydrase
MMCRKRHVERNLIDRREVMKVGAASLLAMGFGAEYRSARASEGPATTLTADEALAALKTGNERYVSDPQLCTSGLAQRRSEVAAHQAPWATILSCADSRVPPELIFGGLGLGELFVARNAGNLVDRAMLGTVEYGAAVLGSPLIVVLAHTHCGAVSAACDVVSKNATYPGVIGPMINPILPAAIAMRSEPGDFLTNTAKESAKRTARDLTAVSSLLSEIVGAGKLKIVPALYDLDSGTVTYLD